MTQRSMAERGAAKVTEVPGSHAIYVSRPQFAAELINDATAAALSMRGVGRKGQPCPQRL